MGAALFYLVLSARIRVIGIICGKLLLFHSELSTWRGLFLADAPCHNFRAEVVFPAHGTSCHPAQHGKLTGVGQRVGVWALKEFFHGRAKRLIGSQVIIER